MALPLFSGQIHITTFVNDLRDIVRYDRYSRFINGNLSSTENTDLVT